MADVETEGINKWIDIVKEAWSDFIYDFRLFGERGGYGHICEEDMRCFLFCKIMNLLKSHKEFLINLHADAPISGKSVDIVLGAQEDEKWGLGVEIKRTGNIQGITADLEKLKEFMNDGKIGAGVFLALVPHSANLKNNFNVISTFSISLKRKIKVKTTLQSGIVLNLMRLM